MKGRHALAPIFEPASVGVVGASADPRKRGHQVVAALQRSGFAGPVHPINPRGGEILGLPVAASVEDIDTPPDLVYVATPAAAVPDVVAACGDAGVRGAIVPAVGFRESGPAGAELERRMLEVASKTGIRIVGPNTSGLLNTHTGLHMVGGEPLEPGAVAIVSQSGNVALDLMTSASARPIGVSIYVGPGNESDVGFHEIIDYLGTHQPTRAIVMYMEGVQDGQALYRTVKRISEQKPIVVLKGGRSQAGVSSSRSHTGSVAGSFEVFSAAARQSGMIAIDRSDELLAVAETLALQPTPKRLASAGAGFVVISDGGGHATIAADWFARLGVPLAQIARETRTALGELFGPASSTSNPVDAAGAPDASPSVLVRAVEIAAADPACAGILLIGLFGGYAIRFAASLAQEELDTAAGLARAARTAGIPLIVHSLYESRRPAPITRLLESGVPVHGSLERAATCCAALSLRAGSIPVRHRSPGKGSSMDSAATADEPEWLSEAESRDIVVACGVDVVDAAFCSSEEDLGEAMRDLPGPWALKAVARGFPHKTEAGAVRLGLEDPEAVRRAFRDCTASAQACLEADSGEGKVDGALLARMLETPIAELVIAARRDPGFGPILTVGFGGVDVDLAPDVAIRILPASARDVRRNWLALRRSPILTGYRGAPAVDLDSLVTMTMSLGNCLLHDDALAEIELNPVFAFADRVVAVDVIARRA